MRPERLSALGLRRWPCDTPGDGSWPLVVVLNPEGDRGAGWGRRKKRTLESGPGKGSPMPRSLGFPGGEAVRRPAWRPGKQWHLVRACCNVPT